MDIKEINRLLEVLAKLKADYAEGWYEDGEFQNLKRELEEKLGIVDENGRYTNGSVYL